MITHLLHTFVSGTEWIEGWILFKDVKSVQKHTVNIFSVLKSDINAMVTVQRWFKFNLLTINNLFNFEKQHELFDMNMLK